MNRYLKYVPVVYLLLVVTLATGISQLYAAGRLHGDYVAEIRKQSVRAEGSRTVHYYSVKRPVRQPVFSMVVSGVDPSVHHGLLMETGKTVIYKECPIDSITDPVGNSCVAIWMYL